MTILTALRPRQDPSLPVDPSIPLPSIPIPTGTNDGTPGGDAPTDTGAPEPSGSPSPGPTQSSETPSVTEPPPSSTHSSSAPPSSSSEPPPSSSSSSESSSSSSSSSTSSSSSSTSSSTSSSISSSTSSSTSSSSSSSSSSSTSSSSSESSTSTSSSSTTSASSSSSSPTSSSETTTEPPTSTPEFTSSPALSAKTTAFTTIVTTQDGQVLTFTSPLPTSLSTNQPSTNSSQRTAIIAGATSAVLFLVLLILAGLFLFKRRKLQRRSLLDAIRDARKREHKGLLDGEGFDDDDHNHGRGGDGPGPSTMSSSRSTALMRSLGGGSGSSRGGSVGGESLLMRGYSPLNTNLATNNNVGTTSSYASSSSYPLTRLPLLNNGSPNNDNEDDNLDPTSPQYRLRSRSDPAIAPLHPHTRSDSGQLSIPGQSASADNSPTAPLGVPQYPYSPHLFRARTSESGSIFLENGVWPPPKEIQNQASQSAVASGSAQSAQPQSPSTPIFVDPFVGKLKQLQQEREKDLESIVDEVMGPSPTLASRAPGNSSAVSLTHARTESNSGSMRDGSVVESEIQARKMRLMVMNPSRTRSEESSISPSSAVSPGAASGVVSPESLVSPSTSDKPTTNIVAVTSPTPIEPTAAVNAPNVPFVPPVARTHARKGSGSSIRSMNLVGTAPATSPPTIPLPPIPIAAANNSSSALPTDTQSEKVLPDLPPATIPTPAPISTTFTPAPNPSSTTTSPSPPIPSVTSTDTPSPSPKTSRTWSLPHPSKKAFSGRKGIPGLSILPSIFRSSTSPPSTTSTSPPAMVGLSTVASAVTPAPPPSAVTSGSPRKSPTLGKNKHVAFDASSSASANANAPPILTSSLSSSPPRASAAGGVLSSSPPRDGSVLSSSLYYRGPPASSSAVYNALPPGAAAPVPIGAAAAISGNGSGPGEVVSPVTYNTVKSNTPSVVEDSGSRPRSVWLGLGSDGNRVESGHGQSSSTAPGTAAPAATTTSAAKTAATKKNTTTPYGLPASIPVSGDVVVVQGSWTQSGNGGSTPQGPHSNAGAKNKSSSGPQTIITEFPPPYTEAFRRPPLSQQQQQQPQRTAQPPNTNTNTTNAQSNPNPTPNSDTRHGEYHDDHFYPDLRPAKEHHQFPYTARLPIGAAIPVNPSPLGRNVSYAASSTVSGGTLSRSGTIGLSQLGESSSARNSRVFSEAESSAMADEWIPVSKWSESGEDVVGGSANANLSMMREGYLRPIEEGDGRGLHFGGADQVDLGMDLDVPAVGGSGGERRASFGSTSGSSTSGQTEGKRESKLWLERKPHPPSPTTPTGSPRMNV